MRQVYRGVEIAPNFISINGTGRALRKSRGHNLHLAGYGDLGWHPSVKSAKQHIDMLCDRGNDKVRAALAKATGAQS